MSAIRAVQLVDQKITVLGGGINQRYLGVSEGTREARERKEILFVGALKQRKGLREAVEALALVQSNYIYRIVGAYRDNDPYVTSVKQRITALGLEERVVFEGRVSESVLQALYQQADLFLMLSMNNGADFEGYGLVYLEANAYGVPCIGPNDSGVSDAIVDGTTGYVVDQRNPSAAAAVIDKVLQQQSISAEVCRAWAAANSIDKKAKIMMRLYQRHL
jgi:glycosyltransferase involved in cell wall biosynthesis